MTDTVDDSSNRVATGDDPLRGNQWVKFDDESSDQNGVAKIEITNENDKSSPNAEKGGNKIESAPAIIEIPSTQMSQLSTIDLPPRREQEGFGNLYKRILARFHEKKNDSSFIY